MLSKFLQELKNRWSADGPKFFNKLQSLGIWCTATSGSIVLLGDVVIPGMPDLIPTIASYFAVAGVVLTAVSKLPVKDPDYPTLDKDPSVDVIQAEIKEELE